ncbi:MAG: death-on-curing protein [Chloroflexi bacterium AL-W]|nr:death-on-curing protein [Chloroflexi bacterium AL-N1]NOK65132.1 death-on-curing protein [Chloroflexi bacterium AL-N10]NOK72601.1 death-on-curing protein [Chloroflexi bacterium AL-N5]NOK79311.1 death-on-curing protein [Chloroflexi bacterium AL-W]NOK87227.1 death-on-curing protein [Chloroflexi bacterium AL-N15]
MIHYLTKNEVLDLHAYVITRYGGRLGIASQDRLISALDAPRQVMFGSELYPDVISKAAALAFFLLKGRPFLSGNQSTALMAMLRFLDINHISLHNNVSSSELLWIIQSLDRSDLDKNRLEEWLNEHAVEKI